MERSSCPGYKSGAKIFIRTRPKKATFIFYEFESGEERLIMPLEERIKRLYSCRMDKTEGTLFYLNIIFKKYNLK